MWKHRVFWNKFATSIQKISEGMTVAGSIAANAGVQVNELAAAVGTMTAITQRSGNEAGRAFRSILMNIRQIKGTTEDGEIIDDEALSKSAKSLANVGIKVHEVRNGIEELRNPMEVLKDLANIWGSLSSMEQSPIIDAIGGKYRGNQLVALLEGFDMYEEMLNEYLTSAGSAMAENEKRMDSWQAKANQFGNALAKMWNNTIDTDLVKLIIDAGTGTIELVDKVGLLTVVVGGLNIALALTGKIAVSSLGMIAPAILAIIVAYNIYNKVMKDNNERHRELISNIQKEADQHKALSAQYEQDIKKAEELINTRKKLIESSKNLSDTDKEKIDVNQSLINSEQELGEIIGQQALDRLKSAGFSEEATNIVIQSLQERQNAEKIAYENSSKLVAEQTENLRRNIIAQIQQIDKAVQAYGVLGKAQEVALWVEKKFAETRFKLNDTVVNARAYDDVVKKIDEFYAQQKSTKIGELLEQLNSLGGVSGEEIKIKDLSNYNKTSSLGGSSSSSSSSSSKLLDSIDAQIRLINLTHELTASKNELLKSELELSKSNGDFNGQLELTSSLIKGQQQQVSDLSQANSKLSSEMKKLGNSNWLDDNAEATLTYINTYNSASKSQQESMEKTFSKLQKLKKAYLANNDAIKETTLSMLELAKTSSLEELKRVQDDVIKNFQELSQTADSFDYSNFADEIRSITYELDKLTGNYPYGISPVDTSSEAMSRLTSYKNTILDIANEVEKMSKYSTTNSSDLETAIKKEIEYANELKSQLDAINSEIREKTLLYKQQEDQLERTIKNISDYYDTQIDKQKEKLKLLDEEIEKEDRLKKLKDIGDEIAKTKADTRFSYIDAEGNETLTYNKAKVAELEQNRDELVKQFEREDLKKAIQDEIDYLNEQKEKTLKVLQQQLENTKIIHQQELASMNLYKDNLSYLYNAVNSDIQIKLNELSKLYEQDRLEAERHWNEIITTTKNSTATLTNMLSGEKGWYNQTINDLNKFGNNVQTEVDRINRLIQALAAAKAAASAMAGGGSVGGGGITLVGSVAHKGGIIGDKSLLQELHVGGTVSGTTPNRITDIVNRLFNVKPGEQVVKMLEGELAVPQQNIMKNFIPNMQKFMSNISLKQTPVVTQSGDTFIIQNATIKANNPQELWQGLQMQIRMNK